MKILRRFLLIALNLGLFVLLFGMLRHDAYPGAIQDRYIYGKGDADELTRAGVLKLMGRFASGYAKRDASQAGAFVERLFIKEDPLVLGTLPTEIFKGSSRVKHLVQSDWESWGKCRFQIDQAQVSSRGDVAWISTRGNVEFDLSRFLVVPLRLSAVAVKAHEEWRFAQMQFQFDVDLGRVLVANVLLLLWLVVNLGMLASELWRHFRSHHISMDPH